MKKNIKCYLKLFYLTFKLSALTFGGGFVIITVIRKKFVDEYKWIEDKEMLDLIAIAQSSPGAIALNATILVGYRVAGVLGAMFTILGTVLPPFIILSMISFAFTEFRDSLILKYVFRGMQAGVAAVIIDVVISMMICILKEKKVLPVLILIGAFIATSVFKVSIILIILVCGGIGAISVHYLSFVKKCGDLK